MTIIKLLFRRRNNLANENLFLLRVFWHIFRKALQSEWVNLRFCAPWLRCVRSQCFHAMMIPTLASLRVGCTWFLCAFCLLRTLAFARSIAATKAEETDLKFPFTTFAYSYHDLLYSYHSNILFSSTSNLETLISEVSPLSYSTYTSYNK